MSKKSKILTTSDVIVVSAPSGTGKTTLNRRLVTENDNVELSISLTTRPMRVGEKNNDPYKFVTIEEYDKYVEDGRMLEWAEVFGNHYGTTLDEIERISKKGNKTLLEIDVQGWGYARKKVPNATSIFIVPPSIKELWNRLSSRGTDTEEVLWRRILTARKELLCAPDFSNFIINDDLESAYKELKNIAIFRKEGSMSQSEGLAHCKKLIEECDNAEWLEAIRSKFYSKE